MTRTIIAIAMMALTAVLYLGKLTLTGIPIVDGWLLGGLASYALFSGRTRRRCIACKQWKSEREMKDQLKCKKCSKIVKRSNKYKNSSTNGHTDGGGDLHYLCDH